MTADGLKVFDASEGFGLQDLNVGYDFLA